MHTHSSLLVSRTYVALKPICLTGDRGGQYKATLLN